MRTGKGRKPDQSAVPAATAVGEDDPHIADRSPVPERTVLTITDDASLAQTLGNAMEGSFQPLLAHTIEDAVSRLSNEPVHLVVVEWGSLGLDFHVLARKIRKAGGVPILAVVPDADTGAACLEAGADDYVCLPLQPRELVARAACRARRPSDDQPALTFGALVIDSASRRVFHSGEVVDLSTLEFGLLAHLASKPGVVFSREQLLAEVWRSSSEWQDRKTVTEHIYRLRRKLKPYLGQPQWLVTVRGKGYRFDASASNGSPTTG